jgi:DNA-binding beta-propeller fold protein YncE
VKIFGSGFATGAQVRLDGTAIATPNPISNREIDVTIPKAFLSAPHRFALDVVSGGVQSNASDFIVVQAVDMSKICTDPANPANFLNTQPSSVAIADQLARSAFAPIAVVSNSNCGSVSVVDINPASAKFGQILNTIAVGAGPQGVAISPRFGVAVVANHTAGTASVVNLITQKLAVADVATGTNPTGVAINEGTGAALVTNTGSNTVSEINFGLLFPPTGQTAPTSLTASTIAVDTQPIAVAIDPDRGTNNRGLAVVTALQINTSSFPIGVLDSVDIGSSTPIRSTTAAVGSVTATPTGVVFDASVSPALFYANSSGGNVISTFNPDTGGASTVHVGINPTSLALNPQTGGIVSVNSLGNTISIVDTLASPFKTRRSYGIPGSPQFGIAIDQLTNLAVIVDQANNRVLLFPIPN